MKQHYPIECAPVGGQLIDPPSSSYPSVLHEEGAGIVSCPISVVCDGTCGRWLLVGMPVRRSLGDGHTPWMCLSCYWERAFAYVREMPRPNRRNGHGA